MNLSLPLTHPSPRTTSRSNRSPSTSQRPPGATPLEEGGRSSVDETRYLVGGWVGGVGLGWVGLDGWVGGWEEVPVFVVLGVVVGHPHVSI